MAVAAVPMKTRLAKTVFFFCFTKKKKHSSSKWRTSISETLPIDVRVELLPQHCYVHELALSKSEDWKCSSFISPH